MFPSHSSSTSPLLSISILFSFSVCLSSHRVSHSLTLFSTLSLRLLLCFHLTPPSVNHLSLSILPLLCFFSTPPCLLHYSDVHHVFRFLPPPPCDFYRRPWESPSLPFILICCQASWLMPIQDDGVGLMGLGRADERKEMCGVSESEDISSLSLSSRCLSFGCLLNRCIAVPSRPC